ncbi:MAG: hypothetical protein CL565_00765 [Alphaproteobacteria bacterium]|nr:hypothetical protein [Alphaproteobacteria bacterium]|tara:strand:- start:1778 stop:2185 length:408 start_codon:yes stop_codon:yes gene_type:complete
MPPSSNIFDKDTAEKLDKRQKPPSAEKLSIRIKEMTSSMDQEETNIRFIDFGKDRYSFPLQIAVAASVLILLTITFINIDRAGNEALTVAVSQQSEEDSFADNVDYAEAENMPYNDFTEMYDQELVFSMYNELAR